MITYKLWDKKSSLDFELELFQGKLTKDEIAEKFPHFLEDDVVLCLIGDKVQDFYYLNYLKTQYGIEEPKPDKAMNIWLEKKNEPAISTADRLSQIEDAVLELSTYL